MKRAFSARTRLPTWQALFFIIVFAAVAAYLIIRSLAITPSSLPGDLNGDGVVNIFDLSILLSSYGKTTTQAANPNADLNGDGNINVFDLSILLSNYNHTLSCALSSFTATNQPSCWRPFANSSPLNTPIPTNPKLAIYSSAVINHLVTFNWQFQNNGAGTFQLPSATNGRPTYFAHPSDPLLKLTSCSGSCKDQNGNSIVGQSFHIPQNATPGTNTDAHLDVIETDTGNEYGFWQAHISWSAGTITATAGDVVNTVNDSGVMLKVGADAAHIALSGGLLRPSELLDATNNHTYIDHALVLDVPCVADGSQSGIPSAVYPSPNRNSDGCTDSSKGDGPPYGSLLQLNMTDAQIASSGAPAWEQTIMKTLAHYGAYVSDTQSVENMTIFRQACESWDSLGAPDIFQSVFSQLGSSDGTYHFTTGCQNYTTSTANYNLTSNVPIPVNRLQVIDACVPQRTC
jgi:hypothetical protein